jgi:hypothetical protein
MVNAILWNSNGLNNNKLDNVVGGVAAAFNPSFIFLTEIHDTNNTVFPSKFNTFTNPSPYTGVAILVTKDIEVTDVLKTDDGRIIAITALGMRIVLAYWPATGNRDRNSFNTRHKEILTSADILLGDFNSVMDPSDSTAVRFQVPTTFSEILKDKVDAFNQTSSKQLQFTNRHNGILTSRIDRVYGTVEADVRFINNLNFPDGANAHCPVLFSFGDQVKTPAPTFRLQSLLWDSHQAHQELSAAIPTPNADEKFPDYISRVISGISKAQQNKRRKLRRLVCKAIFLLKKIPKTSEEYFRLSAFMHQYQERVRAKKEIMAGKRWTLSYGCPSTMLTRMLKSDAKKATVDKIQNESGEILTNPEQIADAFATFYTKLYEQVPNDPQVLRKFLEGWSPKKCSRKQSSELQAPFTIDELEDTLRNMKSLKAPGSDGLPCLPFKLMNSEGKELLLSFLNELLDSGQVPKEWKEGVVVTIFKSGDPLDIANRRPITLLKTVYKILSKMVTERLYSVINGYIHVDQVGFLRNRMIFDNVLVANEVLGLPEKYAISIDFHKAYDSIHHQALFEILEHIGLPLKFRNLIQAMITDSTAQVRLENLSNPFSIARGVKQGDPLSPLLFALAIEPLAAWMRKNCQGATLKDIRQQILLYADDIFLFAANALEQQEQLKALQEFKKAIGLSINMKKSVHVSSHDVDIGIPRADENGFRYLGFQMGPRGLIDNSATIIKRLEDAVKRWRFISWDTIQKATVLSAYIMSKLWFFSFILDFSPYIEKLVTLRKEFMWTNCFQGKQTKRTKMRQERCELPRRLGGLGQMHFESRFQAQKVWIAHFALISESKIGPIWANRYGFKRDTTHLTGSPNSAALSTFKAFRTYKEKVESLQEHDETEFIPIQDRARDEPYVSDKDRLKKWSAIIRGPINEVLTPRQMKTLDNTGVGMVKMFANLRNTRDPKSKYFMWEFVHGTYLYDRTKQCPCGLDRNSLHFFFECTRNHVIAREVNSALGTLGMTCEWTEESVLKKLLDSRSPVLSGVLISAIRTLYMNREAPFPNPLTFRTNLQHIVTAEWFYASHLKTYQIPKWLITQGKTMREHFNDTWGRMVTFDKYLSTPILLPDFGNSREWND